MAINSLGLKTNLHLNSMSSEITYKKNYIVIKTPSRPDFIWGNYIIITNLPKQNQYHQLTSIFKHEITTDSIDFISIAFDINLTNDININDFVEKGFNVFVTKILIATKVFIPKAMNREIIVKEFEEKNWEDYIDIHYEDDWHYGNKDEQIEFLRKEADAFKKLVFSGRAKRYGAFIKDKIIADVGVFWENGIARFNNVSTHRDKRRIGACSTLIYIVSSELLQNKEIKTLVMEADEEYHAAKIYESIGFHPLEKLICLEYTK